MLSCASCGIDLPLNSRFCNQCGAAVAPAGRSAEYKQVTVLFADVVRSMDIAASVDIERLREIMTELLERSAAVVRRYGGTVEYTGDGVMAIFGAPVALEDHAFRACLAAVAIQEETTRLGAEVHRTDKVALQLRVGLNSGRVIAGEIGSGSLGYRATGEHVGMAQRMESAAPPGGVMLSESTAALVDQRRVLLADRAWARIKGADEPVPVRRLLGIGRRDQGSARTEASLVGRRRELAALDAMVDNATRGGGAVVNVVGPPGVGKSRVAREAAALATRHGFTVYWTFCESHTADIPFGAVAQLLRGRIGIGDLDGEAARARVREQFPDADPQDLLLLDDLLGIADPEVPVAQIDPDARRRRLTGLINSASLARTRPALFVIEDVHWIDTVSESMLADFLAVIPQTPSMVVITSRPEYQGALVGVSGAQTLGLGPLDDSDSAALLRELLGSHSSVGELARLIAERSAGNPFFAEEMVRELVQRGVLTGYHGDYVCQTDIADVSVPATVQAAIGARIDRLTEPARRTVNAASVIGARFGAGLLAALGIDPVFDELLRAELIEHVRFGPRAEYAFRHPLIHAVVYESQLKSDRAGWHRRLAAAIQERAPGSLDENAALIAEQLEAAGELRAAYGWHMRAGAWSTNRDLAAARISWERARAIGDRLPDDQTDQLSMRIAPRTMLCATDWQARAVLDSRERFEELRELCTAAGDKTSLAIGMTALAADLCYAARTREAGELATEQMALLEAIRDPTPTMGLAFLAFVNWLGVGEFREILRWSDTIVDLAAGDPDKGAGFGMGSPLAIALAWRGTAQWWLGRPGWRLDLQDSIALARRSNPETLSGAVAWTYGFAIQYGVLQTSAYVVRVSADAVQTAERASSDRALGLAAYTLAVALLNRDDPSDRARGLELMMRARGVWLRKRALFLIPVTDVWAAREQARRGDLDAAIELARAAVTELRSAGNVFYGLWGTSILVDVLLDRTAPADVAEAREAVDSLWDLPADSPICQIMLLRMHTLLAKATGDEPTYRDRRDRYRAMAKSLGFEGHLAWAEMLP
ncbi:AAA family ATPase [Mycobacterium sp. BK086]|uniref:AAA family ATPase n=1 Tax=Mycobacterium sp. BK086 TaxID=2512165 RepID=UPI0025702B57|nr:AAA family ATPase [Mycobacterium sp. BK086]